MALRVLEVHLVPLSKAGILEGKRLVVSVINEESGQLTWSEVELLNIWKRLVRVDHIRPFTTTRDLSSAWPLPFLLVRI
jgi:hypothetical protein